MAMLNHQMVYIDDPFPRHLDDRRDHDRLPGLQTLSPSRAGHNDASVAPHF